MDHFVKRAFIGVNSRWCTSSAARMSVQVRPPFDEAVIEGREQGFGMLLGGWKRMMSKATNPPQRTEVAEEKKGSGDAVQTVPDLAYVRKFKKQARGSFFVPLPNDRLYDFAEKNPGVLFLPRPKPSPKHHDERNRRRR